MFYRIIKDNHFTHSCIKCEKVIKKGKLRVVGFAPRNGHFHMMCVYKDIKLDLENLKKQIFLNEGKRDV